MKVENLYKITVIALLLFFVSPVIAQQIYNGKIKINNAEAVQQGEFVSVKMQIDASDLKVDNQRMLTLTPILTDGRTILAFPPVIINGSARQKAYTRAVSLDKEYVESSYGVLKSGRDTESPISYQQIVRYEPWMDQANLSINEELCGCEGHELETNQELLLAGLTLEKQPVIIEIIPLPLPVEKEALVEQWETAIHFPVGKTIILEVYMDNQSGMKQIDKIINEIKTNKNISVTSIKIEGFASPEGSIARNEQLSQQRADAFKKYLSSNIDLPDNIYQIKVGGENWDELVNLIEASSINYKEDILSIIKNTQDPWLRNNKLETLHGGAPYRQLLADFYPKLRKVVCHIDYTITE